MVHRLKRPAAGLPPPGSPQSSATGVPALQRQSSAPPAHRASTPDKPPVSKTDSTSPRHAPCVAAPNGSAASAPPLIISASSGSVSGPLFTISAKGSLQSLVSSPDDFLGAAPLSALQPKIRACHSAAIRRSFTGGQRETPWPGFSKPFRIKHILDRHLRFRGLQDHTGSTIRSRFSMPTPCSPVRQPPTSTQSFRISAPKASHSLQIARLIGIKQDQRMHVSISGMEHVANTSKSKLFAHLTDAAATREGN